MPTLRSPPSSTKTSLATSCDPYPGTSQRRKLSFSHSRLRGSRAEPNASSTTRRVTLRRHSLAVVFKRLLNSMKFCNLRVASDVRVPDLRRGDFRRWRLVVRKLRQMAPGVEAPGARQSGRTGTEHPCTG